MTFYDYKLDFQSCHQNEEINSAIKLENEFVIDVAYFLLSVFICAFILLKIIGTPLCE